MLKYLEPPYPVTLESASLGCWSASIDTEPVCLVVGNNEERFPGRGMLCHGGLSDTWANPTSRIILLGSRDLARQRVTVQNRKPSRSVITAVLLICQFLEVLRTVPGFGGRSGEEAEKEFEF